MPKISYSIHLWDKPHPELTIEEFQRLMLQAEDYGVCNDIRNGNIDKLAKRYLPQVNWQCSFTTPYRDSKYAIPSGLFALDWDHTDVNLDKFYREEVKPRINELRIFFVQRSASGHGLHIGAHIRNDIGLESIEDNVRYLSDQLKIPYDKNCVDIGRCWLITPPSDWFFFDYSIFDE